MAPGREDVPPPNFLPPLWASGCASLSFLKYGQLQDKCFPSHLSHTSLALVFGSTVKSFDVTVLILVVENDSNLLLCDDVIDADLFVVFVVFI